VLVVEDEPVVRNLIVEVLNELGYRSPGGDGTVPRGLEGRARRGGGSDLLITDIGLRD
jgi:CheY-like chemotaxis protein